MRKPKFTLGQEIMMHGTRSGYIVKEKIYRLADKERPFGIYYGVNRHTPDGKPELWIQPCQLSPVPAGYNRNIVMSEN